MTRPSSPSAGWPDAREILCVRLDSLGDVLMTTPAFRAVKAAHADRRITLLTSAAGAAIAPLVPFINETIVYDAPWIKATVGRDDASADRDMVERLRARAYEAAIIFTVFSQSALPAALLCLLADIPLRLAHARENPYTLLTDWVPDPEPSQGIRHEVERQLALVERVGCHAADRRLALCVPEPARQAVRRRLAALGIEGRSHAESWFVLHPGATAPSRRYPATQFATAARAVADATGARVLVTGLRDEAALVDAVCRQVGDAAVNLAGVLDVPGFAALIEAAPLLVTNNTGPVHIAAAVGTPVVDVYALTNPQHTPWLVPSRVLSHDVECRNCFRSVCPYGHNDCIRRVSPATVAQAACELLEA